MVPRDISQTAFRIVPFLEFNPDSSPGTVVGRLPAGMAGWQAGKQSSVSNTYQEFFKVVLLKFDRKVAGISRKESKLKFPPGLLRKGSGREVMMTFRHRNYLSLLPCSHSHA